MTVLYVIRHGETAWNVEQRMQGRGDSPLTARGRRQAAEHGDLIARLGGVDEMFVSPSGRTRDTAAIIRASLAQAGCNPTIRLEEALLERDSGAWEGLTLDDIQRDYAAEWAARGDDPYLHRPPGGENHADMEVRVAALLETLRARIVAARDAGLAASDAGRRSGTVGASGSRASEALAIVTHGIMSRVIIKTLLDLSHAEAVAVRHPNALFYRLEFRPEAIEPAYFLDGQGPFAGLRRE